MKRPLSVRHERFCEFVASGESQTEAYLKAGFKVSREVARKHAARMVANGDIKDHIALLRQPQTKKAMLTKDRKRILLMNIAEDPRAGYDARIRAMAEDSKMAGHYEPDRIEVESGPNTLQTIKERADAQVAEINRRYGYV